jgi:hypothetical protein
MQRLYQRGKRFFWLAVLPAWLVVVAYGIGSMQQYTGTPGASAGLCRWPADMPIRPASRGITLVLALHPKCPCSAATLAELAQLLSRNSDRVTVYALFIRLPGMPAGWEHDRLWDQASQIPGVLPITDFGAAWSARFGALTSGQTYAFDPAGRLLFSGGITDGRGHMGDNAGMDALADIIAGRAPHQTTAPVYGCSLGLCPTTLTSGTAKP